MRWSRTGGGGIEDRRGGGGGIPVGLPVGGGGLGLLVLVLYLVLGGGSGGAGGTLDPFAPVDAPGPGVEATPDETDDFVAFVDKDVQDFWERAFAEAGKEYRRTSLVLFSGGTRSGCGAASAATGPFYCPADGKAYIDLTFYDELRNRFGAPGDFAQAYVIAHERGHHVQHLLGVDEDVRRQQGEDRSRANELSVRMELQADCLAGVWGNSARKRGLLEPGDLDEGLRAAAAIGDDRIQQQSGGRIDRESWTHGSSEQRARWFRRGFDGGDPSACDTFSGDL